MRSEKEPQRERRGNQGGTEDKGKTEVVVMEMVAAEVSVDESPQWRETLGTRE